MAREDEVRFPVLCREINQIENDREYKRHQRHFTGKLDRTRFPVVVHVRTLLFHKYPPATGGPRRRFYSLLFSAGNRPRNSPFFRPRQIIKRRSEKVNRVAAIIPNKARFRIRGGTFHIHQQPPLDRSPGEPLRMLAIMSSLSSKSPDRAAQGIPAANRSVAGFRQGRQTGLTSPPRSRSVGSSPTITPSVTTGRSCSAIRWSPSVGTGLPGYRPVRGARLPQPDHIAHHRAVIIEPAIDVLSAGRLPFGSSSEILSGAYPYRFCRATPFYTHPEATRRRDRRQSRPYSEDIDRNTESSRSRILYSSRSFESTIFT